MQKATFASAKPPDLVVNMLDKNIGNHGKFTFEKRSDGGYVVSGFQALRQHEKPQFRKTLITPKAVDLQKQMYRAEKSLNLRDGLFAELAKKPADMDMDVVKKLATKLSKQHTKGGWPELTMSWGAGGTQDESLLSAMRLVRQNLMPLRVGNGMSSLPAAVKGVLQLLDSGLEQSLKDSMALQKTTAAAGVEKKTTPEEKRMVQLRRDEKIWMNVKQRLWNGDPALGLDQGGLITHSKDAWPRLAQVGKEMRALGGKPKEESATLQNPLPEWGVNDLAMVADTLKLMKKRVAVERPLNPGAVGPEPEGAIPSLALSALRLDMQIESVRRLGIQIAAYEAIHAQLKQKVSSMNSNSSQTTPEPAQPIGPGAQLQVAQMKSELKERESNLARVAATVLDYERGVGGVTVDQRNFADITMDLLLDEIDSLKKRLALAGPNALDAGTTTTTTAIRNAVVLFESYTGKLKAAEIRLATYANQENPTDQGLQKIRADISEVTSSLAAVHKGISAAMDAMDAAAKAKDPEKGGVGGIGWYQATGQQSVHRSGQTWKVHGVQLKFDGVSQLPVKASAESIELHKSLIDGYAKEISAIEKVLDGNATSSTSKPVDAAELKQYVGWLKAEIDKTHTSLRLAEEKQRPWAELGLNAQPESKLPVQPSVDSLRSHKERMAQYEQELSAADKALGDLDNGLVTTVTRQEIQDHKSWLQGEIDRTYTSLRKAQEVVGKDIALGRAAYMQQHNEMKARYDTFCLELSTIKDNGVHRNPARVAELDTLITELEASLKESNRTFELVRANLALADPIVNGTYIPAR